MLCCCLFCFIFFENPLVSFHKSVSTETNGMNICCVCKDGRLRVAQGQNTHQNKQVIL